MSRAALIRAGGMAAIVGGFLRAAASFVPGVGSDIERQLLYLVVDMSSSCLACCLAPRLPGSDARCGQQPGDFDSCQRPRRRRD